MQLCKHRKQLETTGNDNDVKTKIQPRQDPCIIELYSRSLSVPSSLRPNMFSPLGLFQSLVCPEKDKCTRVPCIFSHRADLPPPPALHLPTQAPPCTAPTRPQPQPQQRLSLTPAKRPVPHTPPRNDSTVLSMAAEPPRKLQKVGSAQRPLAIPSASHTEVR